MRYTIDILYLNKEDRRLCIPSILEVIVIDLFNREPFFKFTINSHSLLVATSSRPTDKIKQKWEGMPTKHKYCKLLQFILGLFVIFFIGSVDSKKIKRTKAQMTSRVNSAASGTDDYGSIAQTIRIKLKSSPGLPPHLLSN
jgi:hypothetical protein